MGAWGLSAFANDDAIDWLESLSRGGLKAIDQAFEQVLKKSKTRLIPSEVGAVGLAAADALACIKEEKLAKHEILKLLEIDQQQFVGAVTEKRRATALKVVQFVVSEKSELRSEWDDSGQLTKWLRQVDRLVKRIAKK